MSTRLPSVHSVHIYDHDSELVTRLCAIASTSLRLGDSVLIVATDEHRQQLVRKLEDVGIDVRSHIREGRYTMLDAKQTLATFMLHGKPDPDLFMCSIGQTLATVRNKARSKNQGMTVFGEMVAVLWDADQKEAALQLEGLWNDILNDRTFHLHCAYPRSGFVNESEADAVCHTHTHV